MRKIYFIFVALLTYVLSSCSEAEFVSQDQTVSLDFNTRGASPALMANMRLFLFDGDNRNNANGQYYREIYNITRTDDKLTMSVEANLWNIGMVSCEDNPLTQLVPPVRGFAPKALLMWRTVPVSGILPNTPEISTFLLSGVNIIPNITQQENATLERHVGMVRVLLEDGVGFSTGSGHLVYLKNVPTSLSWGGSLYPNKDNPEHSGSIRMEGSLTFVDAGNGHQRSDENKAVFIVPTHKSSAQNDTTEHKLTLGVRFNTIGGNSFEKEVVIPLVPRDNKILEVKITARGGVEVNTEIADWNLETSSVYPEFYNVIAEDYNPFLDEWVYKVTMNQERNWWVTLGGDHPEYFECVDGATLSGQLGTTTIRVKRSSLHPGGTQNATFFLYISGYTDAVESWVVQG